MYKAVIIYFIIINITGLLLMWNDKARAKKGVWRISEKTLFLAAVLGGSLGCWIGMYQFRHKTKHWYFAVGMPLILVLQIAAAIAGLWFAGWF